MAMFLNVLNRWESAELCEALGVGREERMKVPTEIGLY
jgi:hypothetical protein